MADPTLLEKLGKYYTYDAKRMERPFDPSLPATIDVPGILDIIKIPALDDPGAAQARAIRMATRNQAMPVDLRWIPWAMQRLDDAQDLIFTGAVVLRYLLPRVLPRLIPGLGWVLLANDVLNLGTAVLSLTTPGRRPKRLVELYGKFLTRMTKGKLRLAKFRTAPTNWTAFAVQGLQASESVTGYGLAIGSLYGAANDSVWTAFGLLGGHGVRIRGPLPTDPIHKAARWFMGGDPMVAMMDMLSEDDHLILLAAHLVATSIALNETLTTIPDARAAEALAMPVPILEPWHETTREACRHVGVDPDGPISVPSTLGIPNPTMDELATDAARNKRTWETRLRAEFEGSPKAQLMSYIVHVTGETAIEQVNGSLDMIETARSPEIDILMRMAEGNVYPATWPSPEAMERRIDEGANINDTNTILRPDHLQRAAIIAEQLALEEGHGGPTIGITRRALTVAYGATAERKNHLWHTAAEASQASLSSRLVLPR